MNTVEMNTVEMNTAETDAVVDRIAHAFSPAEWKGRSLVLVSVVFVLVAAVIVAQRALIADDTTGWVITAVHAVVLVVAVPALIVRATREWRAAQSSERVDQPSGVPE